MILIFSFRVVYDWLPQLVPKSFALVLVDVVNLPDSAINGIYKVASFQFGKIQGPIGTWSVGRTASPSETCAQRQGAPLRGGSLQDARQRATDREERRLPSCSHLNRFFKSQVASIQFL